MLRKIVSLVSFVSQMIEVYTLQIDDHQSVNIYFELQKHFNGDGTKVIRMSYNKMPLDLSL